ncbi:TRAP transporter small permease [Pseudodesulfovibrio piezophilus]|uniref:Tripartite ATP-independent periplasmic transporter DctQ component n=1 Tax=Pseudodesulfovibrio piezophilus (strain DSM 21447 / JCM 15486 / C1TLV30) TaxID=1322246 RepID=M1WRZ3_PSEP2|nr:TRAP transporter small permease [Pseudodesulfovibrio piezophilus]CCH48622.1 Tripartite ATP-independent periplasmic transporter DctQ component [Pseudodesulfovibrio piezophilus C1TLV30]
MDLIKRPGPLDRLEKGMRIVAAVSLFGMALLTGADVAMRGFFNTPIFGSEELVSILGVIAVGFALPYTHAQKSHIGVEIFYRKFSRRVRSGIKLMTTTATLFLIVIVTWRMTIYAMTQARSGEVSMNLELPEYIIIYVLAFGFLAYAVSLLKDIILFFKGREA